MSMIDSKSEPSSCLRVAIYLRYSSDMSRVASLEDQERNCRQYAEDQGRSVDDDYVRSDAAKTGRTIVGRDGLNGLLADAQEKARPFDVLLGDEPSRLGRSLRDVLGIVEILKHYGVRLVLVAKKLDSSDPNFSSLLMFAGLMDQQSSEYLAHRVRRGQEGRTRKGFSTGSRCFGYRSELVPDPQKPYSQNRADMLGTKSIVYEPEAETIRRIYRHYAEGWSDYDICLRFNEEHVVAARKPRIGDRETSWNCALIKRILKNEKYIGKRIWNKTTQVIHPVTGKTETRKRPESEWVRTEVPEMRIVSDDLWNQVQERLKIVNEKMTPRRIAGLNRAKKREYLFSGLLACGVCGSSITIGSVAGGKARNASYSCVSARWKRGCTNNLWIREDRLASQLVHAMANNLRVPEVMEYLAACVADELDQYLKGAAQSRSDSLSELKRKQAELEAASQRLVNVLLEADKNILPVLTDKLKELEVEKQQVAVNIKLQSAPKELAEAQRDLGEVVRANVGSLLDILKQDVPKARQVLQRHIKRLHLYPVETEAGMGYEVQGEIDLFASPTDGDGRVLLARSLRETVQQYTDHLYRFSGLVVLTKETRKPELLEDCLENRLRTNPDSLHEAHSPGEWAKRLRGTLEPGSKLLGRLNVNYIRSQFAERAKHYEERFGVVKIAWGRRTWYMLTKAPSKPPASQPALQMAG